MAKNTTPTRLDRLEELAEKMIQQNAVTDKRFEATDKRLKELAETMVNQNILLGQRIDATNQRIDATLQRIDAQQQHANYLYERIVQNDIQIQQLLPMLEKLPDAVRDQIGFSKSSKANGEKNKKH